MNSNMFQKILRYAKVSSKVDFSFSKFIIPDSIKCIKTEEGYKLYKIDKDLNKTLIAESTSETKLYKATLKYLNIKLDHSGRVVKSPSTKRQ